MLTFGGRKGCNRGFVNIRAKWLKGVAKRTTWITTLRARRRALGLTVWQVWEYCRRVETNMRARVLKLLVGWTPTILTVSVFLLACPARAETNAPRGDVSRFWPQWRGPMANGVAPHANPPT